MTHHLLTITDLPYLEAATDRCNGGDASTVTSTYAGPGVAVAAAGAFADGQVAITRARTNTLVRETPYFSFSRATAFALALSYDGNGLQYSINRSSSYYYGTA